MLLLFFLDLKSCQCASFPKSQKVTAFDLAFFIRDKLHVFQYSLQLFFPLQAIFPLFPYIYFMLFLLSPQSITLLCFFAMCFLYSRPYITNRTYKSPTVTCLKFFKYTRIHYKTFQLHLSFLERCCVHIFPITRICGVVHTQF